MRRFLSIAVVGSLGAVVGMFINSSPLHSQQVDTSALQISTQERLATERWWPTMSVFPLYSFAGSSSCVSCHGDMVGDRPSAMQRAAQPVKDAKFLTSKKDGVSVRSGSLAYYLKSSSAGIEYAVRENGHSLSRPVEWVMGAGVMGRTFLYQADGHWFQSEMTLYADHEALATTTGLSQTAGRNLSQALGQMLTPEETRRCFSCHTVHSTTPAGFNPAHAEAGLGCEACHGPGREHGELMAQTRNISIRPKDAKRGEGGILAKSSAVFDPSQLSPADSIDFCGSCHRTFEDAAMSMGQTTSSAVVRFQPYRLEESKCWRASQSEKLTCVACHNPHLVLDRDPASYDSKCVTCHTTVKEQGAAVHAATLAASGNTACVSCHMPKVNVASMHGDFTDHQIRVLRPGESLPR